VEISISIFQTKKSKPIFDFLETALDLNMSIDPKVSTAKYGTTIEFFKIFKQI
jgi:hypothetical protein